MQAYHPEEIARLTGGRVLNGAQEPATGVKIDSRNVTNGDLFVAISTLTNDGHKFVPDAFVKGAKAALVDWKKAKEHLREWDIYTLIAVDDTVKALQNWANAHRRQFDIPVVAVTGSNGKTTTKDLTAAAVSSLGSVLATQGTLNNHLGVPLTLLEMNDKHSAAIIEMGMNHPGEIRLLGRIAEPTAGVITNTGQAHLEFFNSMDELIDAKWELVETIRDDGFLVLNRDDSGLCSRAEGYNRGVIHWFGSDAECEWHPSGTEKLSDGCWRFTLGETAVELQIPGRHMIHNGLAAIAAACALGVPLETAAQGISRTEAAERRMRSFWLHDVLILDDAYNANPSSMRAGLQTLKELPPGDGGKRYAVLGGMGELGDKSAELHAEVGRFAVECGVNVVAVGELAGAIADGAEEQQSVEVIRAATHDDASGWLKEHLSGGDVVLVKGSRSQKMEQVIDALRNHLNDEA